VENEKRLNKFSTYAAEYYKDGMNKPNPVVKDKEGNLHWLNRKERRAQKKKKK